MPKTAAQIKAEMLKKKAAAKLTASKNKKPSPNKNKGEVKPVGKPAAKVKNSKVYKKIKSTSTYNPKLLKESDEKLEVASPAEMSGRSYDMEQAYNKNLSDSARLHYLENERHDAPGKMKGQKKSSPNYMSDELKYGGPVIDQMKTLSQAGSFKVLKHMKSKI